MSLKILYMLKKKKLNRKKKLRQSNDNFLNIIYKIHHLQNINRILALSKDTVLLKMFQKRQLLLVFPTFFYYFFIEH